MPQSTDQSLSFASELLALRNALITTQNSFAQFLPLGNTWDSLPEPRHLYPKHREDALSQSVLWRQGLMLPVWHFYLSSVFRFP